MTVKSDRWIRRMAGQHGMIEPFESGQIKQVNGRPVVSYGTSSYGYDIRCSDEFKLFTDINSTIVDPKNFDPKSFVDIKGEFCIIPPNSFALARTVEYFRIPRNVLVVCLGKSTYARCLRGDTRVALVDGTAPTLEEMARRADSGELFWGYSIGPTGRLIVALLDSPRYIGRDALLEVVLDDGVAIHATPDHMFLKRDGAMAAAGALRPGDSLMPLYRSLRRGHEMVYQPINGRPYPTHRLADEWNLRHEIYAEQAGTHRRHLDRDRRNNRPPNLERKPAADRIRPHNSQTHGLDFDAVEHGAAIRCAFERLAGDSAWQARFSLAQADRSVFRRFPEVAGSAVSRYGRNHKVLSIRELPGEHDVFCLTVPEAGNFALEAGVFVRNCGIIVNVTPLEPEWEGYVTLEFSNTTPLPAKIYANEGVAQVIFLEAAPGDVCETSYRDRGGKYQGQVGVTLPKI